MKTVLSVVVLAAALVTGCATAPCAASRPAHVVFVGFDGLGGRYLDGRAQTPTIDRMKREGAWTLKSRSVLPSSSAVNWASIFMAAGPEQTGYVQWNTQKPVLPPDFVLPNGRFPDVYALFRAARPEATSAYFYQWGGMAHVVDTNAVTKLGPGLSDSAAEAITYLKTHRPAFFSMVVDHPDHEGHQKGFGGPEYVKETERLDGVLANVFKAIEEAGMADDTVVIVTSDHGGLGKRHGNPTPEEMYRPLLFWGKNVRPGHEIKSCTACYDVGSTLLYLLGVEQPQVCTGRPIREAFEK